MNKKSALRRIITPSIEKESELGRGGTGGEERGGEERGGSGDEDNGWEGEEGETDREARGDEIPD